MYEDTAHTNQVENSVWMSSEFGHLGERGILPHQDLVLGISMRAHLKNTENTFKGAVLPEIKPSAEDEQFKRN